MDSTAAQDLDETRRLLYMALMVSRTPNYELAGTLINSLVHHGLMMDRQMAETTVLSLLNESDPDAPNWVNLTIDVITRKLADA